MQQTLHVPDRRYINQNRLDHLMRFRIACGLCVLIRWGLGGAFLVSGAIKIVHPHQFAQIIEVYGLISPQMVLPAAMSLSLVEFVAGLGLVLDVRYALRIIAGLLIFFIFILSYGLMLGLDVDCGCFGPDDPEGHPFHSLRPAIFRDLAMLAAVGCLYVWRHKTGSRPKSFSNFFTKLN